MTNFDIHPDMAELLAAKRNVPQFSDPAEARAACDPIDTCDHAVGVPGHYEDDRRREAGQPVTDLAENNRTEPRPSHARSSTSGLSISADVHRRG